jgi:K(+)-stimulated pyrophosphate-energized sodium pump
MESIEQLLVLSPYIGMTGFLFALITYIWILKQPTGNEKMSKVAALIEAGSMTFLRREYTVLITFLALVTSFLGWKLGSHLAICYVLGAASSMLCGYIGIKAATKANVRTAAAASSARPDKALIVAFMGGSIMGICVASIGLIGVALIYSFLTDSSTLETLNGFAMGASTMAFFARVGGGIYTKASDMGADLVGKVEEGIPEDDARNPATIADNVGDNVGDTAGTGADLFESYVASVIATMFIGSTYAGVTSEAVVLPLVVITLGLVASLIGILSINILKFLGPLRALRIAPIISLAILFFASYWAVKEMNFTIFNFAMGPFYAMALGSVAGLMIGLSTEYYTSFEYLPVKKIVKAGKTGPATSIISGIAVGMYSCIPSVVAICLSVYFANYFAGLYGIGIAAVGMLATTGITMTFDAYGPIADNASGIAEMSDLGPEVRNITENLDSIGNRTSAIGKGLSIGSATLTVLAIFSAYASAVGLQTINIMDSKVIIGLFIGGVLPFYVGASTMRSVGVAAQRMVVEVRRQFREIPGIMSGENSPNTGRCIAIATRASLKRMIPPGIAAVVTPILVGFFLGKESLGGLLAGSILTGVLLAVFMSNAGSAWDSAKKAIEYGLVDGEEKNGEAHKALVTGDTIGDPFKDTSGPAMNILVKLMSIISLVIAPLLS